MKLAYYDEGRSDKHIRDILGVLNLQQHAIDFAYLADWAARLGVRDLWQDVLDRFHSNESNNETKPE